VPNPLIAEYQGLATALDPLIQTANSANDTGAAQQLTGAQGTLRAAGLALIANDIDQILDPADPQNAAAIAQIKAATTALHDGAAAISHDIKHVSTIVGIATNAFKIASSLVPPNPAAIFAAAQNTVKLLS
jgi:hypothetical protein